MIDYNRRSVIENHYQGKYKRVLCVCSAGVLRSPTTACVLSMEPFDCNTRAAGTEGYALVRVDEALLRWSQEVVCMTRDHADKVGTQLEVYRIKRTVHCLDIPDDYRYRDPELVKMITERYTKILSELREPARECNPAT